MRVFLGCLLLLLVGGTRSKATSLVAIIKGNNARHLEEYICGCELVGNNKIIVQPNCVTKMMRSSNMNMLAKYAINAVTKIHVFSAENICENPLFDPSNDKCTAKADGLTIQRIDDRGHVKRAFVDLEFACVEICDRIPSKIERQKRDASGQEPLDLEMDIKDGFVEPRLFNATDHFARTLRREGNPYVFNITAFQDSDDEETDSYGRQAAPAATTAKPGGPGGPAATTAKPGAPGGPAQTTAAGTGGGAATTKKLSGATHKPPKTTKKPYEKPQPQPLVIVTAPTDFVSDDHDVADMYVELGNDYKCNPRLDVYKQYLNQN